MAHSLTVGHREVTATKYGTSTRIVSVSYLLDDAGRPVHALALDALVIPAMLLLCGWMDSGGGGSPGRRLLGIRLVMHRREGVTDTDTIVTKAVAARRYGWLLLPFVPYILSEIYAGAFPSFALLHWAMPSIIVSGIVVGGIPLLAVVAVVVAIVRRRDAYYDKLAGTEVIAVRAPEPSASPSAS